MTKKTILILRDWLAFPTILILCYFLLIKPYFDKKDKEIIANREYAIAHVTEFYKYGELGKGGQYGNGTSLPTVDFYYFINGRKFSTRRSFKGDSEIISKYNDYLLVVHKNDPEKLILLIDYPIEDKENFQEVITRYEKENIKNAP